MSYLFKLIGAVGMLLLVYGIINKSNLRRNQLFTAGGLLLFIYSAYLRDPVFIPLQIIFMASSIHEIYLLKKSSVI